MQTAVAGSTVLLILGLTIRQSVNQRRKMDAEQQAEQAAYAALQECESWRTEAGKAISRADSLRDLHNAFATFDSECTCLEDASGMLAKADSIREAFHVGTYAALFSNLSNAGLQQQVAARRDSMFRFWNQTALLNYDDYLLLPDEESKAIALRYVNWALRLRPSDAKLLEIKEKLN